jgi:hypothetical protein
VNVKPKSAWIQSAEALMAMQVGQLIEIPSRHYDQKRVIQVANVMSGRTFKPVLSADGRRRVERIK